MPSMFAQISPTFEPPSTWRFWPETNPAWALQTYAHVIPSVLFSDEQGVERLIDFIGEPHGLDADEVSRLAVPFDVERPGGSAVQFWVMNPVHSMESRVYNLGIGKRDRHALAQLEASVLCARE